MCVHVKIESKDIQMFITHPPPYDNNKYNQEPENVECILRLTKDINTAGHSLT